MIDAFTAAALAIGLYVFVCFVDLIFWPYLRRKLWGKK